ncbi:ABC transporter permease [Micromonospora sp. NPDC047074]|uniref:ABC transporter permease n=1 Tax=Micromonospora sp. NPDC047074 TaxID=3154339 RepID=UPI0033C83548
MSTPAITPAGPDVETPEVAPAPRRMFRFGGARRGGGPVTLGIGVALALGLVTVALVAPLLNLADPMQTDLTRRLNPPGTPGHLLGTDQLGRDVLSRVLAGARWSLGIGSTAMLLGVTIGVSLGVAAAWSRSWLRTVLTRAIDIGISFPYLVTAITVVAVVGRGFWALALTLGLVCWPPVARVVYAETLGLREREYVLAARLMGVRAVSTVANHVLPALRPTVQVMAAFTFAEMMISESGLSFLGLGAPLGEPTWGNALSESRSYLATAPWMMLAPAGAIVIAVLAANLIGDGLTARSRRRGERLGS